MPYSPGDFVTEFRGAAACNYVLQILSGKHLIDGKQDYDFLSLAPGGNWHSVRAGVPLRFNFDVTGATYRLCTQAEAPATNSPLYQPVLQHAPSPAQQAPWSTPPPAPEVWKVGDTFEYPTSGETFKFVRSVRASIWEVVTWQPKLRAWTTNTRPWYTPDSGMRRCPDPSAIVTEALSSSYAAPGASKRTTSADPNVAALSRFFAGDLGKKPKGMPLNCAKCGREMSATLDAYNGSRTLSTEFGPAWTLCSTCRPRGC